MKQKDYFINSKGSKRLNFRRGKSMKWDDIPIAFYPIIGLMAEDCNYHLKSIFYLGNNLDITGSYRGEDNRLRLRCSYGIENNLVVANIQFIHRRKGNMTRLYEILKHIKRTYRTGDIVIECVQSEEMLAWCKKNKMNETFYGSDCYSIKLTDKEYNTFKYLKKSDTKN